MLSNRIYKFKSYFQLKQILPSRIYFFNNLKHDSVFSA